MTPEDEGYVPCQKCGDEMSETLQQATGWLCENCYNAQNCGCELCLGVIGGAHHE